MDTFKKIFAADGVTGLWRGSVPTIYRAMVMNMGMLASFDEVKERLTPVLGTGIAMRGTASCISGFIAATVTLPFDNTKSRIQNMVPDANGVMPYKSMIDCFGKIIRERPLAL